MKIQRLDVVIVGGGPAGLAAAVRLYDKGIRNILILEREMQLGGILRQCIHDGFGLARFQEALSGPEYADRFIKEVKEREIPALTGAAVTDITPEHLVTAVTREGIRQWKAKAVVLAMGCRERTRGALGIPGNRPAGVMTAGTAQAYINLYNRMPAEKAVILGSGDIGMIMARRLTLEGAQVKGVYEIQAYPSGLPRNIQQCLNDFGIPLFLNHTVTEIHGEARLTGVTVSEVDDNFQPLPGTEELVECDTLILSAGLIPENELALEAGVTLDSHTRGAVVDEHFQTLVPGIFAAGNVLHVHDLVDFVSLEAEELADAAAEYVRKGDLAECSIIVTAGPGIGHVVPQRISGKEPVLLSYRVSAPVRDARLVLSQQGREICSGKIARAVPAEMMEWKLVPGGLDSEEVLEVRIQ